MTGHIFIYGYIGTGVGENSVKTVKAQIDPAATDYEVHIASGGGDVFEGYAIYNILLNTKKVINTSIEGVCASIATLIAGAGRRIVMNKMGQFMIHNPQIADLKGDSRTLRTVANQLDQVKTLLISVYEKRTGLPKEKLWDLYDKETWLTAEQAEQMGFIDESVDAIKAVAKIDLNSINHMEKQHEGLFKRFLNFMRGASPKNEMTETLEDGRMVIVLTEDEDWTGKQIMLETGEPLESGNYKLASGKTITVGDNSTITEVQQAEMPEAKKEETNTEDMEKDKEIEALKAQIAALTADKTTAEASATAAEARAAKVENRVKVVESELLKAKEELTKTVGDKTTPPKGPFNKMQLEPGHYDPMGEDAMVILKGRNRI